MRKHTPGPWEFAQEFDANGERARITTIAVCCDFVIGLPSAYPGGNYRDGDPSGEAEADARLIAAAPELLDALQMTLPALEVLRKKHPRCPDDDSFDVLQYVRAAIAKATGSN